MAPSASTSAMAALMPWYDELPFGANAMYVTACARLIRASGMPTNSTARATATATSMARGSALPMSSLASTMMRRAMNFGSSPPCSITASQYSAASGSLPRMLLMKAEMTL